MLKLSFRFGKLELTPAGRELAEAAPDILKIIADLKSRVKVASLNAESSLSIVAINVVFEPMFTAYNGYKEKYPNSVLYFRYVPPGDVPAYVLNGSADIGIESYTQVEGYLEKLDILPIDSMQMCVVVGPKHRFAQRKSVYLEELEEEQFVVMDRKLPDSFLNGLSGYEGILRRMEESPFIAISWQDLMMQTMGGNGIAIIPAGMARTLPGCVTLRIENQIGQTPIVLFWKKGNTKKELTDFLEISKELFHL